MYIVPLLLLLLLLVASNEMREGRRGILAEIDTVVIVIPRGEGGGR
jgi:hypothetical protein